MENINSINTDSLNKNSFESDSQSINSVCNSEQNFFPNINGNGQFSFIKKEEHIFLKNFKSNYIYMLIASIIYAVVFTFSLYRNGAGIVTPLYPIASICIIVYCAFKNGVSLKKDLAFYGTSIILLGINLCTTKDPAVILLDHMAILLLTVSMSLHTFYDDSAWGLGKYLSQIMIQIVSSLEYIFSFIEDGLNYKKNHTNSKKNPLVGYIIIGILCTIPLLIVVLLLLGSADYFFGQFLENIILKPLENIEFDNIDIVFMLACSFAGCYAFIKKLCANNLENNSSEISLKPQAIAVTINSILGFVYLIFSGFQIVNLFLGQAKLPDGYTYAEYARQGFFQLVVVCLINMILVIISLYYFENKTVLKVTLTVISACTYLMIVASAYKMYMYVNVYQLTYTRLFVFWALLVIFMAMNGITIYIYNRSFNLFKYCMIMVTILYIGFAYIKPENIIAKNNLSDKFYDSSECETIDYRYLGRLSCDATPAIVEAYNREHDEDLYDYIIKDLLKEKKTYNKSTHIRDFNFSRYIANEYLGNVD